KTAKRSPQDTIAHSSCVSTQGDRRVRTQRAIKSAAAPAVACALLLATASCTSPFEERSLQELRQSVIDASERELRALEGGAETPQLLSRDEDVDTLGIRDEHLEEIERDYNPDKYFLNGGASDGTPDPVRQIADLTGNDLLGNETDVLPVALRAVVLASVDRNLGVQEARFSPAISESQLVAAEAAFDWVFFNDFTWQDTDQTQPGPGFLPGVGTVSAVSSDQTVRNQTGLRRSLLTGGSVSVTQDLIYQDSRQSAFGVVGSPNPSSQALYTVELNQPLLRGFGSDVALAEIRLARNAERSAVTDLRSTLLDTVTEAESAYWDLVRAHRELVIISKLLERGEDVRKDVEARRVLDAVQAQVADAVSTVEARRGDILRAQRTLRRASDRLKAIINDPRVPVGSELLLVPVDNAIDEPIEYSLLTSIQTALRHRPEIDQAILSIDDASIRETVARNTRLPRLDLTASGTIQAFGQDFNDAFNDVDDDEFVDNFLLGLLFEQPLGNRGGQAEFRRRRLERLRSVVTYRRAVQGIVLEVKDALDNVVTNYKLIAQARASRIAAAEALRTLLVEKQLTNRGFTVERLDLEFTQQQQLAASESAEVAALIDYNVSIAQLHRAMGTALDRNRINFVVPDANQIEAGTAAIDYVIDPADLEADPSANPPASPPADAGAPSNTNG
ncbi:MAG: TolC family protein, partial [Planctomycetota bacterium]